MPHVYNIPLSCSLVDVLASHLLKKYADNLLELTDVTVLLPNRRAVRELRNAFIRLHGMNATLLPQILPLGNVDEDGFFFSGNDIDIPNAISPTERLMIFIRLITARPDDFKLEHLSFAQACYLARELASLVDMVNNEQLDFAKLQNLVPEEYAAHWQNTLDFLKIITAYFPQILQERGLIDIAEYNNLLLKQQNQIWQKNAPQKEIIIAGTTATFPAMKELVKTVAEMPNGSVWLSGIDKHLDDASWNMVDETHPQFELKQLLDFLKLSRSEIPDIGNPTNTAREKLFSEVMRPADSTDNWRNLTPDSLNPSALDGLKIINCRDSREEAMVIASIMRQNLETPEKTTALITEDRNLARRVSNELLRWNIKADDSAGIPLSQTPQGIFLRLIAAVCEQDFAPLPLLSLYKHPLSCFGQSSPQIRTEIRNYEKNFLRNRKERNSDGSDFINTQKEIFAEFYNLISQPQASFKGLLTAHIKLAELIASRPDKSGAEILWSGENGEAAAALITGLIEAADTLGDIPNGQYLELFEAMLAGTMVRSKYGSHPRLRILGPIEARLCTFDCIIISSLNEGTMPANSSSGAWLSRPMKKDFGFPLPEKAIGVLAHDFCEMVCGKEVFLTRAERVDGAPTVKSRWLMRLETVLSAISIDISTLFYKQQLQWIRKLERTENIVPTTAPCPKPPLEARPRELWANDIERLLYDPYTIFASKILRLRKTEDINPDPDAIDIGIITHAILEKFYLQYPEDLPQDMEQQLQKLASDELDKHNIDNEIRAFWWPKMLKTIDWIVATEKNYRSDIRHTYCEISGKTTFNAPAGPFTIGARSDRIDQTKDGSLNIIDYKTGSAHSLKQIVAGYAPQLPIEGIIALNGGYPDIPAAPVKSLSYWRLNKETVTAEKDIENVLSDNFEKIKQLIAMFDNPENGYYTKPDPKHALAHSDYQHLSRINEWEVNDNDK